MSQNPLSLRPAATGNQKMDHCPYGYSDPQAWCDWRNGTMARSDVRWIVGELGTPMLVDREDWSVAHAKSDAAKKENERHKFNWRQAHPVAHEGAE